MTIAPMAKGA